MALLINIHIHIYIYIHIFIKGLKGLAVLWFAHSGFWFERDASATSGDHLGPQISKHLKQMVRTKNVHTSGHFLKSVENNRTNVQKYI